MRGLLLGLKSDVEVGAGAGTGTLARFPLDLPEGGPLETRRARGGPIQAGRRFESCDNPPPEEEKEARAE